MNGEIISIGTELLLGQIINTNTRYLSEKLAGLGINVYYHTSVGDNKKRIMDALTIARSRAQLIILTGGLGPTDDDLTKETLAEFLNLSLEINPEELAKLKEFFARRNSEMTENNIKQAAFVPGATILVNDRGTAPGMALQHEGCAYLILPGPPVEMEHMFSQYAVPWLRENVIPPGTKGLFSHVLKFVGIGESKLEWMLKDLFVRQTEPTLALLAKSGEVHLRLTARARDKEEFLQIIFPLVREIRERVGEYLFATDEVSLVDSIAEELKAHNLTVSTAESCTGGMLSQVLTSVPGSSLYFLGSITAYSNDIKTKILGVPEEVIAAHGAVSQETASFMANRIRELTGSMLGIGITGIAGPGGGSSDKPVGLVYIALAASDLHWSSGYHFTGDRDTIRQRATITALNLIRKYLGVRKR
ncbi:MAG: competence/damage-inducible protein cinA [Peptococcaceae bacterium]|jgi:nicotinamide-nucleotide amidase|nr:competence/damage-inducible protein cinA [Peptococcaceae bacterium]